MIARTGKCLTTTKQQKQKHDGTKGSFIYNKKNMIARNVHHVTKKRPWLHEKFILWQNKMSWLHKKLIYWWHKKAERSWLHETFIHWQKQVMTAPKVHSLTKKRHDCTKSSSIDKKHDCTKSSLFDKTKTKPWLHEQLFCILFV